MYDRFPGFIKFRSSEADTKNNTMSHLYFNGKVIILRKIIVTMNSFAQSFSNIKRN